MILQALTRYYDILFADGKHDIPPECYASIKVDFALVISKTGELLDVLCLKDQKKVGKNFIDITKRHIVPEREIRTRNKVADFLCDKSMYVLGLDRKGKEAVTVYLDTFELFKERHLKLLEDIDNDEARALRGFVAKWKPNDFRNFKQLVDYEDEIFAGAIIAFKVDGGDFIHNNNIIKNKWELEKIKQETGEVGRCLISGKVLPRTLYHTFIKGVPNTKPTTALVSFNKQECCESYGKLGNENALMSRKVAFKYATMLNFLLSNSEQKLVIGDMAITYWVESDNTDYNKMASLFFAPEELTNEDNYNKDSRAAKFVGSVLEKVSIGDYVSYGNLTSEFKDNLKFYILAISPNVARLSVRFFLQDSFGGFVDKILKHYEHLKIEKSGSKDKTYISINDILKETVSEKEERPVSLPLLSGEILKSIILGNQYPSSLHNCMIKRIKAGDRISYIKAAVIKAYLTRKNKFKEETVMSLNEKSEDLGYLSGRLFAVLEKLQQESIKNVNTTIKDKYFATCSTNPTIIFGTLLKLAQHHLSKLDDAQQIFYDKKITAIVEKIENMPKRLSMDEQGVFILGYYHQKNDLWKKTEDRA